MNCFRNFIEWTKRENRDEDLWRQDKLRQDIPLHPLFDKGELHDIGEGLFHAAEVEGATDQDHHGGESGD